MRRTAIAAVLACAMLLAVSIVSPAFGGPSIASVAKTAKKALKAGKSANRAANAAKQSATTANSTANSAKTTATAAQSLAGSANGKADQALARPSVNPAGITTVTSVAAIDPSGIGATAAVCPAGQRVISGGVTTIAAAGGTWTDRASDDRTGWIGGGEDLGTAGGTVTVFAYCVPAGAATIASNNRAAIRGEVAAAKRLKANAGKQTARASHTCSSGYKHAVTPDGHKCLRAGQYCSTQPGYASVYKSKGYVCKGGRLKYR